MFAMASMYQIPLAFKGAMGPPSGTPCSFRAPSLLSCRALWPEGRSPRRVYDSVEMMNPLETS